MSTTALDLDALWRAKDAKAEAEEPPYVREALRQFAFEAAEIATILKRMDDGDPYVVEAVRRILTNYEPGARYHAQWLARYTKLITATVKVGGEQVAQSVGFDFNLGNPRVIATIRTRAAALVTNVTETTKASIRAAVEAGRAQGMGVRDIAKLIHESTFGAITKTRAVAIARTETVGAMNAGEHQAAVQSGVLRSKTWLHQRVGNSRPNHVALDGVTIDIGAAFNLGTVGAQYPHAPGLPAREAVNCRCSVTYSDEEAPA